MEPACLHCERQPAGPVAGLCTACATDPEVRVLYRRRAGWTPAWERHLRRLTARARRRLPLFPPSQEEDGCLPN